jgi:hypothetical protein
MRIGVVSDTHDNLRSVRRAVDPTNWRSTSTRTCVGSSACAASWCSAPANPRDTLKGHDAVGIVDLAALETENLLF